MKTPTNKPLILIVDDSPQNLQVLGILLGDIDCEIAVAANGQQALDSAWEQLPDIILLDVMMPVMDGHEACKRLKEDERTKDIPVIFLTALTDTDDIVKGFKLGAADYVSKPFNGTELLARVRSHLHVRQIMNQLEYVNATKNKFFSIIAHDLKNPFYTIIGFAEMLIQNIDSHSKEDQLKFLSMIHSSGKDAHSLLENLLNWSRLQIGTMKANKVPLNSFDLVERVIHFLEPMANKKSIELIQQDEDGFELFADEEMLSTILRNLGSNAIKFTKEGGTVNLISTSPDDEENVQFIVEDNGIGMSDEIIQNLFRIDTKQSRKGTGNESGTGLGLILCKEFAEYHNGSLKIESEVDKGSRFIVTIPTKEESS